MYKIYNKVDYDLTNSVVSQCLEHVSNSAHEEQYIYTYSSLENGHYLFCIHFGLIIVIIYQF